MIIISFQIPLAFEIFILEPIKDSIAGLPIKINILGLSIQVKYAGITKISSCKLQLNGIDRFSTRDEEYFRLVQPYQRHTSIPSNSDRFLYLYSFALKPEEHQPSGTCNFSRIDSAQIIFDNNPGGSSSCSLKVFAVNYNVLRIMSGMGGLAYSN